jgi:hypothetical protein
MDRIVLGWALIVLGLAGLVGGGAMIYVASAVDRTPTESEQAEWRMRFHAEGPGPGPKPAPVGQYVGGVAAILVGVGLVSLGLRLRTPPVEPERPAKKKRKRNGPLKEWYEE